MDSLLLEDQEQVAVYDNEEEREKLYNTVLQNICSTLDSISKLEHDTKKATTCLQVELESKQAKENELKEKFQKFQNDIIAKARLSTRNDILNSTIIAEFGKDEKLVSGCRSNSYSILVLFVLLHGTDNTHNIYLYTYKRLHHDRNVKQSMK